MQGQCGGNPRGVGHQPLQHKRLQIGKYRTVERDLPITLGLRRLRSGGCATVIPLRRVQRIPDIGQFLRRQNIFDADQHKMSFRIGKGRR